MKRRASKGEERESRQNESALAAYTELQGGSSCLSRMTCKAQLSCYMINFSSLLESARSLEMFRFGAPKDSAQIGLAPGLIC